MEEARSSEVMPAICAYCRKHRTDAEKAICGDCLGGTNKPEFEPKRPWMAAFHWIGILSLIVCLGFSANIVLKVANNGYFNHEAQTACIALAITLFLGIMAKREDNRLRQGVSPEDKR